MTLVALDRAEFRPLKELLSARGFFFSSSYSVDRLQCFIPKAIELDAAGANGSLHTQIALSS